MNRTPNQPARLGRPSVKIEKEIDLPIWNEGVKQKVITYWSERGITFNDISGDVLTGRRGSVWGNLTSFDMSKLMARLTVSLAVPNTVSCVLDVNTILQGITEWNRAYWQLEMETFESFLLTGDKKDEVWRTFLKANKKASLAWTLSLGAAGRELPKGNSDDET
jgi:hypothetical protein